LVALAAAMAAEPAKTPPAAPAKAAPVPKAAPAPPAAKPAAPTAPAKPAPPKPVAWQSDMKVAWAETKTSQRPLLVFIVSEGCVYCEQMEAQTFRDERVARAVRESFVPNKLQAADHQPFIQKLGIRIFPATVIIAPDAHVIDQISGYIPPRELEERLTAAAAKKVR
jgi:protein disulfide-isomerase